MAVAHDGEANVTTAFGTPATSHTWTGKTTAGSDRIGILAFAVSNPAAVSGVTWNGVAMTQKASVTNGTDNRGAMIFYIVNPPTAASDIVLSAGGNVTAVGIVSSYNGAHQSTQDGATGTASGTATPATVDCTSTTGDMVVDALYFIGAGTAPSVGAGQTQNGNTDQGTWFGSSSREAGATTVTMSWTLTSATRWSIAAASIKAADASSSTTVTPATGSIVAQGRAPTVNVFTNVRIREVLINEAGSPVASQTGIHLVVWYGGAPSGAPDLSYSDMTTDTNGSTSWSLATGSLAYNQGVFYVAHDGHASMSVFTCARMIPTYS